MSTTTEAALLNPQSPVKPGEWFEVLSYIGDAQHPMVGKRIKAGSIGIHYVFPSLDTPEDLLTCFRFSEVRRVEPTEQERALENHLLDDLLDVSDCDCGGTGHDSFGDPCDGPKGDGCYTDPRNLADARSLGAA